MKYVALFMSVVFLLSYAGGLFGFGFSSSFATTFSYLTEVSSSVEAKIVDPVLGILAIFDFNLFGDAVNYHEQGSAFIELSGSDLRTLAYYCSNLDFSSVVYGALLFSGDVTDHVEGYLRSLFYEFVDCDFIMMLFDDSGNLVHAISYNYGAEIDYGFNVTPMFSLSYLRVNSEELTVRFIQDFDGPEAVVIDVYLTPIVIFGKPAYGLNVEVRPPEDYEVTGGYRDLTFVYACPKVESSLFPFFNSHGGRGGTY